MGSWKFLHQRVVRHPGNSSPILRRWTLIETPLFGLKVHHLVQSDPSERGFHDHPWDYLSLRLRDLYIENILGSDGIIRREHRRISRRKSTTPHRIDIPEGSKCWTLVLTGHRRREWGFVAPRSEDGQGGEES